MSILAKTIVSFARDKGIQPGMHLTGLHHVEEFIVRVGKEAAGNFLTNLTTELDTTGLYNLTHEEKQIWNNEREQIRQKYHI